MSRILKRPMFRRGGKVNQGIMSGLVDRTKLEDGTDIGNMTEDQFKSNLETLMGVQDRFAPVAKTRLPLGDVGLALIAGQSPIDALTTGYKKFTSEDDKRRALLDKRKSAAVSTVLSQALKKEKDTRTEAVKNAVAQGLTPGTKEFNEYIRSVTVKSESQTAAIKNALAQGLVPGTKEFNDYITAATIKGAGLQIKFDAEGRPIITQGNVPDDKEGKKLARQLKIDTFKMNNAASNLFENLEGAKTGPVGSFVTALDSTSAQLKQAADAFGFSTTGKNKTFDDTGSGAIDNYIEKNFGSFVGNDAVQLGKIKSASINLAYLMARIDEPGGRFTDRDIALKMEELGIGANPERTIAIMKNAIKLRNDNAAFEYQELTGGEELDFSNMNIFGATKKTKSEPSSDVPEFKILSTGEVLIKKDGKFVPYEVK
jgi:hypothetical protein